MSIQKAVTHMHIMSSKHTSPNNGWTIIKV